jgi:ACS family sodium-dependent inorganic phosphate cotransporter
MSGKSEFLTCQRVLGLMVLLGSMIHHMLRVNISIAIIEMVNRNNTTSTTDAPRYNWDEEEKNNVLGYFFWGYVLTQIPGGRLSEIFGTKIIIGIGIMTASLFTILTPISSYMNYYCLLFVRFALGIALGVQWPSMPPMATKWVPPTDMSKFLSHLTASSLGVAVTLPMCGYLIDYWGWPSVFYVTGTIALTWTICWFYLIYDSPEQHPRISENEKLKLRHEIKRDVPSAKKKSTPWKKILTSGPVWAIVMANTCASFTFFIAFMQLPTYMSHVLHFSIKANGWLSSLPYFVRYCTSVISSCVADFIKKSERLSTTAIRKTFCSILFFGTFILFAIQAFWGYNSIVSVAVFTSSLGLMGLATPGIYANSVDIAPAYSGTVYGISQVPAALAGYALTKIVAVITKDEQSFQQWIYVFWIVAGVNLFAFLFCLIFISGDEQSWNHKTDDAEIEKLQNDGSKECP